MNNYIEIKFNNRNEEGDEIACGQGGGFLSFHSGFVL